MSFLAPVFLAGLGLLAVPILIHLTQRQQSKVTAFPSLMFLRRVPFRTSNRRRIRNPLLFALRCLALILIASAFARPFVAGAPAAATGDSARDVVLLLDTSHSLSYDGLWDRAVAEAAEVLDGFAPGDRAALITFSDRAHERTALTEDLLAVRTALGNMTPGARGTRFDPGLQLAGRILAESDRPTREVILISDFQRVGWGDGGRTRLPEGVVLRPIDLSDPDAMNVAVADVAFHPERNGRVRVVARVANMGSGSVPALDVSLELDGRTIGTRQATLPPRGVASISFEGVALPAGSTRGEVRIEGDDLAGDDALRFIAAPDEGIEVLLLEGSAGRGDRSLFLERALAIGDDPVMRVTRRRAAALDPGWLSSAAVVILNDADVSEGSGGRALLDWVRAGGGLIVLLGPRAAPGRWPQAVSGLLGGQVGGVEDRSGRGGSRLGWLDYDHAVFELFSAPRSGDFSDARFFRFQRVDPAQGTSVLARYEDGEPALTERSEGEGRVLVWTSTLDRFWNDLALQPVYLPFVHRLVRHASAYHQPERSVPVGRVAELGTLLVERGLARAGTPGAGEWVLVAPDGERRSISLGSEPVWLEFEQAGFYELRPLGSDLAETTVAVNPALEESDLTALAPERLIESVAGGPGTRPVATAEVVGPADEETRRRELWWPLLLAAALMLVIETILANRWARRRTPPRGMARAT
jgi:hypothetical protein